MMLRRRERNGIRTVQGAANPLQLDLNARGVDGLAGWRV